MVDVYLGKFPASHLHFGEQLLFIQLLAWLRRRTTHSSSWWERKFHCSPKRNCWRTQNLTFALLWRASECRECRECHVERFNLIKRCSTNNIYRKTLPWSVLLAPYLYHLTFDYSFLGHRELLRKWKLNIQIRQLYIYLKDLSERKSPSKSIESKSIRTPSLGLLTQTYCCPALSDDRKYVCVRRLIDNCRS